MQPDISLIVVTYKERLDVLKACFDSVAGSNNVSYELIVVDNGAQDTTRGLLQSYEKATYIRNERNEGFAAAVNKGIARAGGRYIVLLNPDTSFEKEVLAQMTTHMDADQEVGIGSALIRYPDGSIQPSIRRFPTVLDQLLILLKIPHIFSHITAIDRYMMKEADPMKTQDVDSIMGAFMWVRDSVVQQVGPLDERYFIWFEEVDYCKMVSEAGWKVRHYADVEITHQKGHTFAKIGTWKKQKWMRQSLRKYMHKHYGWRASAVFWILTPLFWLAGYIAGLIKRT